LVAKLFKDGEIAFYVNSESVTLLSKSRDEIVRFITRKEFNDRLMTEKRVRASEKQKKAVREIMKELFGVAPSSDDDDAVMGSFLSYAARLKDNLEKLEIHYKNQPLYPGKKVVLDGKKLMIEAAQLNNANEFFVAIDRERDDFLDFAEDYDAVKRFFASEQVSIFDKAIKLMTIYDDSRTFIVNEELESTVEQIKAIMKKTVPYTDIKLLPGLLDKFNAVYSNLLSEMEEPVIAAIDEARSRVLSELKEKLCENVLRDRYIERFGELNEKATHCNNVAVLQNIKVEADALKVRCLNEIAAMESRLQAQKAAEEAKKQAQQNPTSSNDEKRDAITVPAPKVKKQRTVSIKSINTETTWQLETTADVKKYITELEKRLLAQLEDDTVVHIEF